MFWLLVWICMIGSYAIASVNFRKDNKRVLLIVLSFFLFFLAVFRPLWIPDTMSYKSKFEMINGNEPLNLTLHDLLYRHPTLWVEYGFVQLGIMVKKYLADNYLVFFAVVAMMQLALFSWISKKLYKGDINMQSWFICMLLPYFGYMYLLVPIRAGLAIALGFTALLLKKRSIGGIALSVAMYFAAFAIHRMAVFALAIELIYRLAPLLKREAYLVLWLISGVFCVHMPKALIELISNGISLVGSKISFIGSYDIYYNSFVYSNQIAFRRIYFWLAGIFILCSFNVMSSERKKAINIYIIGLYVMNFLSFISGSSRVVDWFFISIPLLLTEALFARKALFPKKIMKLAYFVYNALGVIVIMRL